MRVAGELQGLQMNYEAGRVVGCESEVAPFANRREVGLSCTVARAKNVNLRRSRGSCFQMRELERPRPSDH
eukprot:4598466-Pyramimonas_sp.AAC.2